MEILTMTDIRIVDRAERDAVADTLTLAFSTDPVARHWWPEPSAYLTWWPKFAYAMGERGYDHAAVMAIADFAAVAMWLPSGVEADTAQVAALEMPARSSEAEA